MATDDVTAAPWWRYTECPWGDVIEGTKEQLQALGLGVGRAFPGEVGAPRYEIKVSDLRGFPVRIANRYSDPGQFTAYLSFPNWPKRLCAYASEAFTDAAPGVKVRPRVWFDEYVGDEAALAAAGLIREDQLPGAPGMPKTVVRLPVADGPQGRLNCRAPGARVVYRMGRRAFSLHVVVDSQEEARRQAEFDIAESRWLRQVAAMRRPARLQPLPRAARASRAAMEQAAARDVAFQGMLARMVAAGKTPRG